MPQYREVCTGKHERRWLHCTVSHTWTDNSNFAFATDLDSYQVGRTNEELQKIALQGPRSANRAPW